MELRRLADRNKRITLDTFYEFNVNVDVAKYIRDAAFEGALIPVLEWVVWGSNFLFAILSKTVYF